MTIAVDMGRKATKTNKQISVTMSISKIFKPNCVCVLTNERYKTYYGHVAYQINGDDEQNKMQVTFSS